MVERFFFDRVHAKAARATITIENNFIAFPTPYITKPSLPFVQPAFTRANITLQPPIRKHMPIMGGMISGWELVVCHHG